MKVNRASFVCKTYEAQTCTDTKSIVMEINQ